MHVVTLNNGFSQAVLIAGNVSDNGQNDRPGQRGENKPIGNVDFRNLSLRYRFIEVAECDDEAYGKKCHHGPDVFPVFTTTIINACHQTDIS